MVALWSWVLSAADSLRLCSWQPVLGPLLLLLLPSRLRSSPPLLWRLLPFPLPVERLRFVRHRRESASIRAASSASTLAASSSVAFRPSSSNDRRDREGRQGRGSRRHVRDAEQGSACRRDSRMATRLTRDSRRLPGRFPHRSRADRRMRTPLPWAARLREVLETRSDTTRRDCHPRLARRSFRRERKRRPERRRPVLVRLVRARSAELQRARAPQPA